MARKKISQREAVRLRQRVRRLESALGDWMDYAAAGMGGVTRREETVTTRLHEFVKTSRALGGIVVAENSGENTLYLRVYRRPDV